MSESYVRRSRPARGREGLDNTRRAGAIVSALLVLAGCSVWDRLNSKPTASAATPTQHRAVSTATPPAPAAQTAKPKRVVREARDTKEPEKVASLDPKNLIGLQPAAVERLLGSPSNVSSKDPSLVWTYAGQGCSFQVFFYPDLKTATFHALKYSSTAGEQADNACIRNILMVKSNGPS